MLGVTVCVCVCGGVFVCEYMCWVVLVQYQVLFDTDRYLNFVRYSILTL